MVTVKLRELVIKEDRKAFLKGTETEVPAEQIGGRHDLRAYSVDWDNPGKIDMHMQVAMKMYIPHNADSFSASFVKKLGRGHYLYSVQFYRIRA